MLGSVLGLMLRLALASGPGFTPQGSLSFPGAFMPQVLATLLAFKVSGLAKAALAWLIPCPSQTRDLKREESGQHLSHERAPGAESPLRSEPGPEARARHGVNPNTDHDGSWSLPRRESWRLPPKLPGGVGAPARDQRRRCGAGARVGVAPAPEWAVRGAWYASVGAPPSQRTCSQGRATRKGSTITTARSRSCGG